MFGVARESHLFIRIEFAGRVEQSENAGVNEIVEIHMHGQVLMYSYGDRFDEREMFEHDAIAASVSRG
jgi:hypothetical protein